MAMKILDRGRLHIGSFCVGVAERLIADCVAYMGERKQFGQPLSSFQLLQGMIADMGTEVHVGLPRGQPFLADLVQRQHHLQVAGAIAQRGETQLSPGAGQHHPAGRRHR